MTKQSKRIDASQVIVKICRELNYSRAHVAKMLRDHARALGAKKVGRSWMILPDEVESFREVVKTFSGPRYKLGETGPNR